MPLHLRRHFFAAFAVNCCSAALFTQLLICIFVSNSHATRARHRQSASVIFQPTFQLTRPTRGATLYYVQNRIAHRKGWTQTNITRRKNAEKKQKHTRTYRKNNIVSGSPSDNKNIFGVIGGFRAEMLYLAMPVIPKIINSQTVTLGIDQF